MSPRNDLSACLSFSKRSPTSTSTYTTSCRWSSWCISCRWSCCFISGNRRSGLVDASGHEDITSGVLMEDWNYVFFCLFGLWICFFFIKYFKRSSICMFWTLNHMSGILTSVSVMSNLLAITTCYCSAIRVNQLGLEGNSCAALILFLLGRPSIFLKPITPMGSLPAFLQKILH